MPPAFQVRVDSSRVRLRLEEMPTNVRSALRDVTEILDVELVARARSRARSELNVRSGKYLASIRGAISETPRRISGKARARAKQAAILEYGGNIPPHEILPNKAGALAFLRDGAQVFAAAVQHPGAHITARKIIHGAFSEMRGDIVAGMTTAVQRAVEE